jgi:hypothetical protein
MQIGGGRCIEPSRSCMGCKSILFFVSFWRKLWYLSIEHSVCYMNLLFLDLI